MVHLNLFRKERENETLGALVLPVRCLVSKEIWNVWYAVEKLGLGSSAPSEEESTVQGERAIHLILQYLDPDAIGDALARSANASTALNSSTSPSDFSVASDIRAFLGKRQDDIGMRASLFLQKQALEQPGGGGQNSPERRRHSLEAEESAHMSIIRLLE